MLFCNYILIYVNEVSLTNDGYQEMIDNQAEEIGRNFCSNVIEGASDNAQDVGLSIADDGVVTSVDLESLGIDALIIGFGLFVGIK
jgi:hypothetical protein